MSASVWEAEGMWLRWYSIDWSSSWLARTELKRCHCNPVSECLRRLQMPFKVIWKFYTHIYIYIMTWFDNMIWNKILKYKCISIKTMCNTKWGWWSDSPLWGFCWLLGSDIQRGPQRVQSFKFFWRTVLRMLWHKSSVCCNQSSSTTIPTNCQCVKKNKQKWNQPS